MINLLPPDIKQDLLYARRNTLMRRWIFAFLFALIGVGLIVVGGIIYMQSSIKAQTAEVENLNTTLKTQKVDETSARLQEISSGTKLTLQVLSREILFSKLLKELGSLLPKGVVLQQFQVDKVQGALTLTATATDVTSATQLQVNLADPKNKIFEKADIENISCATPSPDIKYPCSIQLRTLFAKNTSFTYILPTSAPTNTGATKP